MVLEKLVTTCTKYQSGPLSTSYIKVNPKWIKGLEITPKSIKYNKENMDRILRDIDFRDIIFNDLMPLAKKPEAKIKRDHIKIKSFCTAKDLAEWEKIFAHHNWQKAKIQDR